MRNAQTGETSPDSVVPQSDSIPDRPNVEWWKRHGGREWLEELERRRSTQDRYSRQEAWLGEHFAGEPALRVLDFGCGYGRHLRHLRQQRHLDLYGCDVSPNMIAVVGEHVSDVDWAREHVRLIGPVGRLPFDDRYFDVSYTSEVLIHVHPDDLTKVLLELMRVTFERLILIENKRTDQAAFGSAAHAGCWVHDLVGTLAQLGFANVQVLDHVLEDQDVYLVDLEPETRDNSGRRFRSSLAARDAEIRRLRPELSQARRRLQHLEGMVSDALVRRVAAESGRQVAEERLARLEHSLAVRAVRKLKQFKRSYRLLRGVIDTVNSVRTRSGMVEVSAVAASVPAASPALPFAGIAISGSPATPEDFIAASPSVVSICHPHWRGIRASTLSLCDGVLQMEEILSDEHAEAIASFLQQASTRTLVIQGIPPGSQRLAVVLRRLVPRLRILNVFHGSTAQQTFPSESEPLREMIALTEEGVLDGIGFVKVGIAECLQRIGVRAYPLYSKIAVDPTPPPTKPFKQGPVHIGVFVPNIFHKNLNTQLMAALVVSNSIVHVTELPALRLDRYMDRIMVHGLLDHSQFLELLGQMDVNLYVTLSECFPMTIVESLQRGVICLTSDTSPIFQNDEFLRKSLVVAQLDDPSAIATQLEAAVANRVEIVARAHVHLQRVNEKADELWERFAHG